MNVRTNTAQVVSARGRHAAVAGALLAAALAAAPAHSGPDEQARRIYERIAGVPPSAAELASMSNTINTGCGGSCAPGAAALVSAAQTATSAAAFYNVTLKNMVIPWTNRDQTVFAPLNDYAATVIGMVRDDVDFHTALSADILYVVNGVSPAPSNSSNAHYVAAEANGVDLSTALKVSSQSAMYGTPTAATAGLLTTYGAESAFFINGTNRAMFRFTMINHLCNDMPTLMDTSRPTDRIRCVHFCWNAWSPTASTSSTTRISGSRWAATANARRTCMPLEYRLTGVSIMASTSANATISSNFLSISAFFIPRIAPLRYTFSRPVNSP